MLPRVELHYLEVQQRLPPGCESLVDLVTARGSLQLKVLHFDHLVTSQSFGQGVHAQPMMDMRVGHARPPYIGGTVI